MVFIFNFVLDDNNDVVTAGADVKAGEFVCCVLVEKSVMIASCFGVVLASRNRSSEY